MSKEACYAETVYINWIKTGFMPRSKFPSHIRKCRGCQKAIERITEMPEGALPRANVDRFFEIGRLITSGLLTASEGSMLQSAHVDTALEEVRAMLTLTFSPHKKERLIGTGVALKQFKLRCTPH